LLSDELKERVCLYAETTGSTGGPTPAFYTPREFRASTILSMITPYSRLIRSVLARNRTCLNGITFGFTIAGASFGDLLVNNGALVANAGSRSTIATPERTARAIARLKPSVIAGSPIDFLSWMRIVKEDWPDDYDSVRESLEILISTAELCSPSRERRIEEEFGIVHINVYACVEGFFSLPCPCGEKHVIGIYHPEVFTDDLKKIPKGRGRFAFTNLLKKSSPMVRYLLDDTVTLFDSQCPWGFRRSVRPHGRHELSVRIGDFAYNVDDFEDEIFRHGLYGDYRVTVHGERLDVELEEFGAKASPADKVESGLAAKFSLPAAVRLVPFGTITKYREVRQSKPILKILDGRSESTQTIPEFL
jgi:phenylacetate-CoA ligase